MGQKANPVGLRLGINRTWESNWFAEKKDYGTYAVEDLKIRKFIQDRIWRNKNFSKVEISDIRIKRFPNHVNIVVSTSRPGLLIGKKGADIDELRKTLSGLVAGKTNLQINVHEVKKVDLDARIVAQVVGRAIEARMPYKRAMKQSIQRSMRSGAKGIKIQVSGRLGGNDIARREYFKEGSIPLHTFAATIDHGKYSAMTTYGVIGVQVWVHQVDADSNDAPALENAGSLVNHKRGNAPSER